MASPTAGDVLVETLMDWGVDTIFGIPGDGINGIMEALRNRKDQIRFIQVRHEEAAAFMACAYAKWTGKLGVCLATSGPGGIHLLNGLYDAKLDGQPVLAITGLQFHDLIDTYTQQDVELDKLFMDVCVYNARVMGPAHVENVVELACRTALAYRGVAHVTVPVDLQSVPIKSGKRSERNVAGHVSELMVYSSRMPSEEQVARAIEILNSGKKTDDPRRPRRARSREELIAIAERLGAPIAKPLLGKAAVPDDSPFNLGGVGLLGTRAGAGSAGEVRHAFDRRQLVPLHRILSETRPGARGADRPRSASASACATRSKSASSATAGASLQALLPLLDHREDRSFLEKAQKGMKEWRRADGGARHAPEQADEAAGRRPRAEQAAQRRRHRRYRFRYHHHLDRPAPQDPRQHDVLVLRQSRYHGLRAALRDRRRGRPSGPPNRSPSSATADSPC